MQWGKKVSVSRFGNIEQLLKWTRRDCVEEPRREPNRVNLLISTASVFHLLSLFCPTGEDGKMVSTCP